MLCSMIKNANTGHLQLDNVLVFFVNIHTFKFSRICRAFFNVTHRVPPTLLKNWSEDEHGAEILLCDFHSPVDTEMIFLGRLGTTDRGWLQLLRKFHSQETVFYTGAKRIKAKFRGKKETQKTRGAEWRELR